MYLAIVYHHTGCQCVSKTPLHEPYLISYLLGSHMMLSEKQGFCDPPYTLDPQCTNERPTSSSDLTESG